MDLTNVMDFQLGTIGSLTTDDQKLAMNKEMALLVVCVQPTLINSEFYSAIGTKYIIT